MAISTRVGRRQSLHQQQRRFPIRFSSKRLFRTILISLAFIALVPPLFFIFKLKTFRLTQLRKCGWLNSPPLVCAHGGDSSSAFPNTMAAYHSALNSQVDCIEIDVSRSSDGVLLALHDRDLQRISGNNTSKVGHFSMKEIKHLGSVHQSAKFHDANIPTIEEALKLVSSSVRQVVLDVKVGPPSYEKGLARDVLAVIERIQCRNCVVWAKSDNLARDVIRLSSDVMVGYIVMIDQSTGARTNLLRMRDARVVGVYHPLIDEKLVRILHGRNKKVYAWTVDDAESMENMLFEQVDAIVTSKPRMLQALMQDTRRQCLEHGFSLSE
ncbi:putative glycerophosphodiester phosphodiesterase [Rosa chinensis]|uniref:glycerophosphodiester phosphodiesterase n=1 Tax=Rosa chinensis TaxID=74649 RepID=A0A2P6PKE2_ROSCH|nr:glycerophosphodiester phosphodiesterase GDPD4 [Rosa chinensis]PRQ22379.1 putative glycerophosphodiester phosphodiesterase [Rosa chinensis]